MSNIIIPAKVVSEQSIFYSFYGTHCTIIYVFSVFSDILDAILNFSKCSMMTGCHHPEPLMVLSNLQESVKKKKLYTTIPGQIDFVPDY